jgi:hypothetical protein
MPGDTLTTGDGILKDSYPKKKLAGFQKLAPMAAKKSLIGATTQSKPFGAKR